MKFIHICRIRPLICLKSVGVFLLTAAVTLAVLVSVPALLCDQFVVKGESMEPTLHSGEHLLVNKLKMGARIYKNYDFSQKSLSSFRMPALGRVKVSDVVIFNYPDAYERHKIEFKINYVYAKRCIGLPGDTVGVRNGYYWNSSTKGVIICPEGGQRTLRDSPDSTLTAMGVVMRAFPHRGGLGWTIRNYGPMLVPRKGSTVRLDSALAFVYARAIEYETGNRPKVIGGQVLIGGKAVDSYTFTHNWFFFGGDNVLNSRDSRYFGIVPEDFIIGVATNVIFSKNPYSGRFILCRRIKKMINLHTV